MTLPADFWHDEYLILLALLLPKMEELANSGADIAAAELARLGISFDSRLTNRAAADWARAYTDRLLQQLQTTTADGVGAAISEWFATPGATRADLEAQLKPLLDFNQARVESVGVTEVTRAVTRGEYLAYAEAGVKMPPVFESALGAQPFGPPAHPHCRCWTRIVRLNNGDLVVVWSTRRDELVCTKPVSTPWGTVAGCRALHNTILSDGPYLGKKLSDVQ